MRHVPQKCALGVPQLAACKETWVSLFFLSSHRLWTQPAGKDPEVQRQPLPQPWLSLLLLPRAQDKLLWQTSSPRRQGMSTLGPWCHPSVPLSATSDATLRRTAATDKNKWMKTRYSTGPATENVSAQEFMYLVSYVTRILQLKHLCTHGIICLYFTKEKNLF